jgi:hypothetical protein
MIGTFEAWTSWSVLEVDHLIVWNIIEACVFWGFRRVQLVLNPSRRRKSSQAWVVYYVRELGFKWKIIMKHKTLSCLD